MLVIHTGLPFAHSTIYDPNYPDENRRLLAATALCVINNVILREASRLGAAPFDMRLICNEPRDFANPTVAQAELHNRRSRRS